MAILNFLFVSNINKKKTIWSNGW